MVSFIDTAMRRLIGYGTNIGAVALATVMFIIVANVIYRAFGGVIVGTYDLVEITIVIVAAFSIADTEIHKRHTSVDMVTNLLSEGAQLHVENGCNLISFLYWGIIAWGSAKLTIEKAQLGEVTELLRISIIPFRALWVFGLILICMVIVYNIYCNFKALRDGKL
jgi:TRAP-type C4-dicarboxylate transport system permease small subunit